jgi:hypothetical protein
MIDSQMQIDGEKYDWNIIRTIGKMENYDVLACKSLIDWG